MAPLNGGETFPDLFWRRDAMLRILVVDDHADTVDSTVALLKSMGTFPRGCLGGADAVQQARDFVPQLILLDLAMPAPDGFRVAQDLLRASLPIFILAAFTGSSDERTRDKALAMGFTHFVYKPPSLESLRVAVHVAGILASDP
jgi:CheY-like chemotaxis protein